MDTNKMREQFESKFPTPIGMVWCDVAQQYIKALGCICPATAIAGHNQLWKCWQASREAVVVELPPKISWHNTTEGGFVRPEAEHYDEAIEDCRSAIEAQGLKVTP